MLQGQVVDGTDTVLHGLARKTCSAGLTQIFNLCGARNFFSSILFVTDSGYQALGRSLLVRKGAPFFSFSHYEGRAENPVGFPCDDEENPGQAYSGNGMEWKAASGQSAA